jgi:uncharacterized protein YdiU (UPF0061 family)
VSKGTARLAASYIGAGFVHGVLNSDNIAITAESFDYGPWRFTPFWDGGFTAAYFDHAGLYAFGRQPEAIHWDLVQLAASLRLIAEPEALTPSLDAFPGLFQRALAEAVLWRLGVKPKGGDEDSDLLIRIEAALAEKNVEIDRFFFDWRGGRRRGRSPADAADQSEAFQRLGESLRAYASVEQATSHDYWKDENPCSMHIEEVESIWSAIDEHDDWSILERKVARIRRMGEALASEPAS